ncbi:fimbrial protein [Jeongeupia wiesaeckerbachi]|uniref:fimbrial protein n=1 Tax=Jeongeupia wiesaeckerbachi TaxID=3051218 RepID=UPI003D803C00
MSESARPMHLPRPQLLAALLAGLAALLSAAPALAGCGKLSPYDNYPLSFNFGGSIVVDQNTPLGTPIAQATVSGAQLWGVNGGWFGKCDNASNTVRYWWLEQHWSRSANQGPIAGVVAPTKDGKMYVMQDSGSGNPYGDGSGSGSVGYTVELLSAGQTDEPFAWVSTEPRKNLPPLPADVPGIPCADAKAGTGAAAGYPLFTGSCGSNERLFNWRQLPQFSFRASLYRLAGTLPANGVQLQNNSGAGFSLFSVMNNESTPPANNTQLFNLVRFQLQQNTLVRTSPCGNFGQVNVDMGRVSASSFTAIGQPARGEADKNVAVAARCAANTSIQWAVVAQPDAYDATGGLGVIGLDASATPASGVAVQLLQLGGAPLPLTLPGSNQYNWVGNGATADAGGNVQLNFRARYIQVRSPVMPGTANAHATLVIAPK